MTLVRMSESAGGTERAESIPIVVRAAMAWFVMLAVVALSAQWLVPSDALTSNLLLRLRPPVLWGGEASHVLGTDELGRDLLARLVLSIKTSLLLAVVGTTIGAVLGTAMGMAAAAIGGLVDELIMMLVDVQAALPFIIIALTVVAVFGNQFWLFMLVVGVYGWERYARIARGMTLAALEDGYSTATAALGGSPLRIHLLHILPNIAGPLIVAFTLNFPETLLLETTLSFLGLGIQPPATSLGTMLGDGRTYITSAWWIAVVPGLVLASATLAASLIGDWLQDRLSARRDRGPDS